MTVTIEHLKAKPIEGDAVLWDGTYPQAQSLIAWLSRLGIVAAYSAATPGVPASIEITTEDDTPDLYPDSYVLVTAAGAVHLIEDAEAAAFFDEPIPPVGLAEGDKVIMINPWPGLENVVGTVTSVYQDGELQFAVVEWPDVDGFQVAAQTMPSPDLQKQ